MKNSLFLIALVCVAAFSAAAQKSADFSGMWTLDSSKSKLDERQRIESITMNVTQTDKDIKIETATKRLPPPADAPQPGGRGGGRGGFGGGDGTVTYTLDGKESQFSQEGPMGAMPVTVKAKIEDGKLKLSQSRTFSSPMGEATLTTNETWSLSEDGKTLTVNRETASPRGNMSSEMVFTKK
jgi:hypothetical protein